MSKIRFARLVDFPDEQRRRHLPLLTGAMSKRRRLEVVHPLSQA